MSSHSQIASPSSPSQETKITDEQREKNEEYERYIIYGLANAAVFGQWAKVVHMYNTHGALVHTAILNKAGDTALRIAISAGQTDIAKHLVDLAAGTPGALEQQNPWGDTVLHVAAYLGKSYLCHHIAGKNPELIGIRNNEKETPLFLAAHFGHLKAFLSLNKLLENTDLGYNYGRRGDGETILHTAIYRCYYDMAFHIIKLYPNFVHAINEKGFSPLYLMASTPSAFRSGCPQIRGIHQLFYRLIHVNKLELQAGINIEGEKKHQQKQKQKTCISSPWHRIMAFKEQGSDISKNRSQGPNRLVSIIGLSLECLIHAMSVIFGPGTYSSKKLKETKQNNVWSKQIMQKLVDEIGGSTYEHNGMNPDVDPVEEKRLVDSISTTEDIPITDPAVIYPIKTEDDSMSSDPDQKLPAEKIAETVKGNITVSDKEAEAQEGGNKEAEAQKGGKIEAEAQRREREALMSIVKKETPILVAARNGVLEIVIAVLENKNFELAIHDSNTDNKNVVLLAAENRRADVYDYLRKTTKGMPERIFGQTDKDGNSALHLAAKLCDGAEPWPVQGPAWQMHCEVKWYEFVKNSMPRHFFRRFNQANETPEDIFKATHTKFGKESGEWLNKTSNSFSNVATVIATAAFATSAIVPGGASDGGSNVSKDKPAFSIFAISSLTALCFSIFSVIMFLAILTSRYQQHLEFGKDLPRTFLIGLTSLFLSIISMLISFCAGHSFVVGEELISSALALYAVIFLGVTLVTIKQFPYYIDLFILAFRKNPWGHK